MIADTVELTIRQGTAPGAYPLFVGVYRYPSLERLIVPGSSDNILALGTLTVR